MSVSRSRRVRFIRPFGLAILLGALIGVPAAVARVDGPEAASPVVAAAAVASTRVAPASVEPAALGSGQLTVVKVTGSLSSPLGVTNAGDGSGRLFVVEQSGRVRIVKGGKITGTFLDLRSRTDAGGERGLLGLAFHPDFPTNGYVYAYYTTPAGSIRISRYTANAARTFASLTTEYFIITIPHPTYANHNGGGLAFGPDGYLYAAVGDGGSANDPGNNGQDKDALLGKILRIDVNGSGSGIHSHYAIPADNPFVGAAGADEIWDWGLRNPWRISFDRVYRRPVHRRCRPGRLGGSRPRGRRRSGWQQLWLGDHGRGRTATACPAAPHRRTTSCRSPSTRHSFGCSITGGYVYRGSHKDLQGLYVYGDFCSGRIWTMNASGTGETRPPRHQPQHLVVRRERGRRAVPDRPERIALSRHRARVQRHRQLELHRRHPLVVLPGHHGRVRQRQVLPAIERHARADGAVPRPRLQPSTDVDRLLHRRQRHHRRELDQRARRRPASRAAASRISSARRAR